MNFPFEIDGYIFFQWGTSILIRAIDNHLFVKYIDYLEWGYYDRTDTRWYLPSDKEEYEKRAEGIKKALKRYRELEIFT